jgi:DNA-directed RNA polymerase sigma subunit (sigma70/sigma32)
MSETVIPPLLDALSTLESQVVELRHGLDGGEPRSRAAVADALSLTAPRVRRIEASALAKLSAALTA